MKRRNLWALVVVLLVTLALPAGLFGYQAWRTQAAGVRVIAITAHAPQTGGFAPDHLQLRVGEPMRLHLSSPDVVHGFRVPGLGIDVAEILPGKPVDVDITPQQAGRYAFACTRWCGIDHWRMRGEIEVVDAGAAPQASGAVPRPTTQPPLYQQLGQDLDAMRMFTATLPTTRPDASRGAALNAALPGNLRDAAARRALSPADAFRQLRAASQQAGLSDDEVWDLVAWAWLKDISPTNLHAAQKAYTRDCAACHGPEGKGDGPAGKSLPGQQKMDPTGPAGPADFTNAELMLATSDAVLQGKMLRGGMGTGMPEFGSLYTDDELWALVGYVRSFTIQPQP